MIQDRENENWLACPKCFSVNITRKKGACACSFCGWSFAEESAINATEAMKKLEEKAHASKAKLEKFAAETMPARADLEKVDEKATATLARVPKRLSRKGHPAESAEAAKKIAPKLARLYRQIGERLKKFPGRTANELADLYQERDVRKMGRRLPEMVELGLAHRGRVRTCEITSHQAVTWYSGPPESSSEVK